MPALKKKLQKLVKGKAKDGKQLPPWLTKDAKKDDGKGGK